MELLDLLFQLYGAVWLDIWSLTSKERSLKYVVIVDTNHFIKNKIDSLKFKLLLNMKIYLLLFSQLTRKNESYDLGHREYVLWLSPLLCYEAICIRYKWEEV